MKVVVLMGSPRKKDGERIVRGIEKKINLYEDCSFDYVYLRHENLEDCRGCGLCFSKGEAFCPIRDNLKDICKRMEEADGVIFACPVYAHQITAPMKKFIERLSFYFHRPVLFGKFSLIVATTASTGLKGVIDYLTLTAKGWGLDLAGSIGVNATAYFSEYSGYSPKYETLVNRKIDRALSDIMAVRNGGRKKSPDLFSLTMFLAMREKTKRLKGDIGFWESRGWFKSRYYYDVKLGLPKLLAYYAIKNLLLPVMYRSPKSAVQQ